MIKDFEEIIKVIQESMALVLCTGISDSKLDHFRSVMRS